ncbi:MAG: GIY-YIG nuclease family protein [Cellulosilyticaceae bacterium]
MNTQQRQQLKEKATHLLEEPGVYWMLDANGRILYIGKSIHIKTRILSYLRPDAKRSRKIARMLRYLQDFQVFYTDTELDALLLECRWIKAYQPSYNTMLTKQNRYFYMDFYDKGPVGIKLSKKEESEGVCRIGPFTNTRLARKAYGYLRVRDGVNWEAHYQGLIGLEKCLEKKICEQMMEAAEHLAFEEAAMFREQLVGIRYVGAMARLIEEIQGTSGVWRMPIGDGRRAKYYLVGNGILQASSVGYSFQEPQIVKCFKDKLERFPHMGGPIGIYEIDEALILRGMLKREGMHLVYKRR